MIKWIKKLLKELINPRNVATSIILAIILALLFQVFQLLVINKVEFRIYSEFGDSKSIESENQTILYFTLVNTGTIPLEINKINFAWYDYSDKDKSPERWREGHLNFYDENGQIMTQTIILPYEKIKIHSIIKKPQNMSSELQIIQICPHFESINFVAPYNYKYVGICNKFYKLFWIK